MSNKWIKIEAVAPPEASLAMVEILVQVDQISRITKDRCGGCVCVAGGREFEISKETYDYLENLLLDTGAKQDKKPSVRMIRSE